MHTPEYVWMCLVMFSVIMVFIMVFTFMVPRRLVRHFCLFAGIYLSAVLVSNKSQMVDSHIWLDQSYDFHSESSVIQIELPC